MPADRYTKVVLTLILICLVALVMTNLGSAYAQRSPTEHYTATRDIDGFITVFVPRTGDIWLYVTGSAEVRAHWRVVEPGKPIQVFLAPGG